MINLPRFFVRQKFRMDIAMSFLTVINFVLLCITASDKVQKGANYLGIKIHVFALVATMTFLALGTIWLFGYLLDHKFKYWQNLATEQNKRNPQITEILKICRDIETKDKGNDAP